MPLVTRHTTRSLTPKHHDELLDWIRSLGLDPNNYAEEFAISRDTDGWNLHLCERQINAHGDPIVDYARNEVATLPREIPLGPDPSWPDWLHPASAWGTRTT